MGEQVEEEQWSQLTRVPCGLFAGTLSKISARKLEKKCFFVAIFWSLGSPKKGLEAALQTSGRFERNCQRGLDVVSSSLVEWRQFSFGRALSLMKGGGSLIRQSRGEPLSQSLVQWK